MSAVVEVDGLHKRYGPVTAVDGISLSVEQGEVFGIIGTNGAGKTTTVEIMEGLRTPDGGRVRVLGLDPATDGRELRRRIGVQLQTAALPNRLRVAEALDLFASFYPVPADTAALMRDWDLGPIARRSFTDLSGGQRQRLFIALALIGHPELVFLDELTTGLDPQARRAAWSHVLDIRDRGVTVVLVTHFMEEAERLCDRVAVVHAGRVVALDTPAALAGRGTLEDAFLTLTGADDPRLRTATTTDGELS
jgi:ABC-2 type transport system ATP-binding protein